MPGLSQLDLIAMKMSGQPLTGYKSSAVYIEPVDTLFYFEKFERGGPIAEEKVEDTEITLIYDITQEPRKIVGVKIGGFARAANFTMREKYPRDT